MTLFFNFSMMYPSNHIIVLGERGVGKSTFLNALMRRHVSETGSGRDVTKEMKRVGVFHGHDVYDSPGMNIFGRWDNFKGYFKTPSAILVIMDIHHCALTDEQVHILRKVASEISAESDMYLIVTKIDELKRAADPVEKWKSDYHEQFQKILDFFSSIDKPIDNKVFFIAPKLMYWASCPDKFKTELRTLLFGKRPSSQLIEQKHLDMVKNLSKMDEIYNQLIPKTIKRFTSSDFQYNSSVDSIGKQKIQPEQKPVLKKIYAWNVKWCQKKMKSVPYKLIFYGKDQFKLNKKSIDQSNKRLLLASLSLPDFVDNVHFKDFKNHLWNDHVIMYSDDILEIDLEIEPVVIGNEHDNSRWGLIKKVVQIEQQGSNNNFMKIIKANS